MTAEEKAKKLRELVNKYRELRRMASEELQTPVDLGRFNVGEEAKERLRLYAYYAANGRLVVPGGGLRKIELGQIQLVELLRDVVEYAYASKLYDKRIMKLRNIDVETWREAKEALERLRLVVELIRQTLGNPYDVITTVLG